MTQYNATHQQGDLPVQHSSHPTHLSHRSRQALSSHPAHIIHHWRTLHTSVHHIFTTLLLLFAVGVGQAWATETVIGVSPNTAPANTGYTQTVAPGIVMTWGADTWNPKNNSVGITVGTSTTFKTYYTGSNNSVVPTNSSSAYSGATVEFEPEYSGYITVVAYYQKGKKPLVVDETGTAVTGIVNVGADGTGTASVTSDSVLDSSADFNGGLKFPVVAGKKYYVGCSGSKMVGIYGFIYTHDDVSISAAPTITTNLEPTATASYGIPYKLSIKATGNVESYKWFKDGVEVSGVNGPAYAYVSTVDGTSNVYCQVKNSVGTTNSTTCAVSIVRSSEKKLLEAKFSNSFLGFIKNNAVQAYYLSGGDTPTLESTQVSDYATASGLVDGKITVTAQNETTQDYPVTLTPVTPLNVTPGTNIPETTFDGNEDWIKTGYVWASDRGWKFSKNADDGRIQDGRTRLYFFVGKSKSVTLTNTGVDSDRDIKVYVNGVEQVGITKIGKSSGSENSITINTSTVDGPTMIAIISNQVGGDGGFTKYSVVAPDADTPTPQWEGFELDFTDTGNVGTFAKNNWSTSGAQTRTGISFDKDGNPYEDKNDSKVIDLLTYYNNEYGLWFNGTAEYMSFDVPGPVQITFGKTNLSNDVTISNSVDNSTLTANLYVEGAKYYNNHSLVTSPVYYTGGAARLTIKGGKYIPYIKVEPYEVRTFKNFALDFTAGGNAEGVKDADGNALFDGEGDAVKTIGVIIADDGTPTFTSSTDGVDVKLTGKLHGNQYGICGAPGFEVAVPGSVIVKIGTTDQTGSMSITDAEGNELTTLNIKGGKYSNDKANVVTYIYQGESTTLKCSGSGYVPYIAVKKYDPSVGFELDFTKGDAKTIASELPASGSSAYIGLSFNDETPVKDNINPDVSIHSYFNTGGYGVHLYNISNDYFVFDVSGPCTITLGTTDQAGSVVVKDMAGNVINSGINVQGGKYAQSSSNVVTWDYTGGAARLKLVGSNTYLPYIKVEPTPEPAERTFTDFKVDFRTDPYTVIYPAALPTDVTVSGSFEDAQHGAKNPTITVPVDGPVDFIIGSCQYGKHSVTIKKDGTVLKTIDNNNGCENKVSNISSATYNNFVTYKYNNKAKGTLTFEVDGYLPFFEAKACEYVNQVTVKYYDVDKTTVLKEEVLPGNSELAYSAEAASKVTVAAGSQFRGFWKNSDGVKVKEGTTLTEDLNLYPSVTPTETVSEDVNPTYPLTDSKFYMEEHDLISVSDGGGEYHDGQHGWEMNKDGHIDVKVAGNATITIGLCMYSATGKFVFKNSAGTTLGECDGKVDSDGTTYTLTYTGGPETISICSSVSGLFIHNIAIKHTGDCTAPVWSDDKQAWVLSKLATDQKNAAQLEYAIANVNSQTAKPKVLWIPNGTYDFGAKFGTEIPAGFTLRGESMEGVIIKNQLPYECIDQTATLRINGDNVTLEDLTLRCRATYGNELKDGAYITSSGERGVCLMDRGNNNIFRRIKLDGYQDTYYSWKSKAGNTSYFYDCVLMGNTDFLCGSGNVWFENCKLLIVPCHSDAQGTIASGRTPYIVAPSTNSTETGYTFNNCTIDNATSTNMDGKFYLGRGWQNTPKATYINTVMKIKPMAQGWSSSTASQTCGTVTWKEVGSVDANGTAVSTTSRPDGTVVDVNSPDATPLPAVTATVANSQLKWTAISGAVAYSIYKSGIFHAMLYDTPAAASAPARNMRYATPGSEIVYELPAGDDGEGWTVRAINALGVLGLAEDNPTPDPTFATLDAVKTATADPFGFATATSRTAEGSMSVTGGGMHDINAIMTALGTYTAGTPKQVNGKNVIVLQSTGEDQADAIKSAIAANDIIIFDGNGANGADFIIGSVMKMTNVNNKTILGINGATLKTQWQLTAEDRAALNAAGANTASSTGKVEYKGEQVDESEKITRETLEARYGNENYRNAGIFEITTGNNLIIRNIKFDGPGGADVGGYDLLAFKGVTHSWVDHCEFVDGIDGNFDITNASDFVTVSWNKFSYTSKSYAHQNSNLVGNSDSSTGDRGKLNVTFAYNEWGSGVNARMPRTRFGKIHILNNYYNCAGNGVSSIQPGIETETLIDANLWETGVKNIFKVEGTPTAYTWNANNVIKDSTPNNDKPASDLGTVTVPYNYSSMVLNPETLPTVISANIGAILYDVEPDPDLEEVTLYSWESPEGTVIETGGTIAYVNGEDEADASKPSRLNYANSTYHTICLNGKKENLGDTTPSANAGHMEIIFNRSLKAGDKIKVTGYYNKGEDKDVSIYFKFMDSSTLLTDDKDWKDINRGKADVARNDYNAEPLTYEYEVPAGAEGDNKLILTRDKVGTNLFITKLEITGMRLNLTPSDLTVVTGKETLDMVVGEADYTLTKGTDYTTSSTGAITYSSSDATVATIDASGKIHALKAGTATITIRQADSSIYEGKFVTIAVTVTDGGIAYPITATWDFTTMAEGAVNIQQKTGTVESDVEGIVLDVDAGDSTNKGKLYTRGGDKKDAQFNVNTTIKVPVTSKYDVVNIETKSGSHNFTIGGVTATSDSESYTATEADVTAGYVSIVATATSYLKSISVTQQGPGYEPTVDWTPTWNATAEHWEVKQGKTDAENGESLIAALDYVKSQTNKTLFIPNGTYDLGTAHNTSIPAGFHLIGESQNGVLIKNQPTEESINQTATLQIDGANVTLEKMTLKCRAPYTTGDGHNAERGVCVQDCGNGTHYINVTLDGLQDTYYSNGAAGMTATFDDCIVRGNVDFFCGNGNITVNNSRLQIVTTHTSGGTAIICAPATYTTETQGYLFNNCTVEAATSAVDCVTSGHSTNLKFNLARAWYAGGSATEGKDRTPRVTFKDTDFEITQAADWGGSIGYAQAEERRVFQIINTGIQFSPEAKVIDKTNKPFAYATANDRSDPTKVDISNITGGGEYDLETIMEKMEAGGGYTVGTTKEISTSNGTKKAIVLKSANTTENGKEKRVAMDQTIIDAINNNDIIVLDGAGYSDFVVKSVMTFRKVENKTVVGIKGARLCTEWYLTDYFKSILENVPTSSGTGVNSASTAEGTGGDLYDKNGNLIEHIKEEGEFLTRKYLYDAVGNEDYRYSGIFYLGACKNWIIRNLKLVGPGSLDCAGYDLMAIIDSDNGTKFSDHMWVDHCEFIDGMDGNFDITNGSDFITVSWCQFRYTDRSYAHQNTNLVGSSDDKKAMDGGKLNITFAYNEWGANCRARMPMARFGRIHMLNNYYSCTNNSEYAMNPRIESEFLIEGNVWARGVRRTYEQKGASAVTWGSNNLVLDPAGTMGSSIGTQPVRVPYQYSAIMLDPAKLADVISLNGGAKLYKVPNFTTNLSVADNTPGTPEYEYSDNLQNCTDGLMFSVWAENAHTFQWYRQDINLDGSEGEWTMLEGENRNSFFYKPEMGEEFRLKCKAFGVSGQKESDVIKVSILGNTAPIYVNGLPKETVTVYSTHPQTFTAKFREALEYQWYRNASAIPDGATKIDGATTDSYTYTPTTAEIVYFFCKAKNNNGKGDRDSPVVKVKGVYRNVKLHYYVDADTNVEHIVGGNGGKGTAASSDSDCKISLTTSKSSEPVVSTGGLRFTVANNHTGSHMNVSFENSNESTNAYAEGDKLYLKIGTTATADPAKTGTKYGFYMSTSASEEGKFAEIIIPTNDKTSRKEPYEVLMDLPTELVGTKTFYFIPIAPGGKYVNLHEVLIYSGETKPVDAPIITKDLEKEYEAYVGHALNLTVEVEEEDDIQSYQWYTCNDAEDTNPVPIENANTKTYAYTPDKVSTKYFYCLLTGKKDGNPTVQSTVAKVVATIANPSYDATVKYITADIKADGAGKLYDKDGTENTEVMESMTVALGSNNLEWQDVKAHNNVNYAGINIKTTKSVAADAVRFVITPNNGKVFIPSSISLGAIRYGTDAGTMTVKANGVELKEHTLKKESVIPGRNNDTSTQDGYTFSYDLTDIEAKNDAPLTFDIAIVDLDKGKQWGIADVFVEGQYREDIITNVATPKATKGDWQDSGANVENWPYTLSTSSVGENFKMNYQIGEAESVTNQPNPVTVYLTPGTTIKFWGSDTTEGDEKLEDSKTVTLVADPMKATETPAIALSHYDVARHLYTVTISNQEEQATVYYTTDGSDPATSDTKMTYSAAFTVAPDTPLKTIAVREHYASSPVIEGHAPAIALGLPETFKSTGEGRSDDEAKGMDNVLVSATIDKANISGVDGATGLKYTIDREVTVTGTTKVTGIQIDVHEGFVINEVQVNNAYSNKTGTTVTVNNVYVDGVKLEGFVAVPLPNDKKTSFTIPNINAQSNIILEISQETDQARAAISVVYDFIDVPTGVTITDVTKTEGNVITLEGDALESFKENHTYTVTGYTYPEDPIVVFTTQKGYTYTIPVGTVDADGEKLTNFTKNFVGVPYTIKAKVNPVKSPNIVIGNQMSLKGGYKVELTGIDKTAAVTPYINIDEKKDAQGNLLWEVYDDTKEYYALHLVQSRAGYVDNGQKYTDPRSADCPDNEYTPGKPFAAYIYVDHYTDGTQTSAESHDSESFVTEDKTYIALKDVFNVINVPVGNSDAILDKRPDITDAKLVVISETIGGSGSAEIAGVGNSSTNIALTLKRDVVNKTNVLNFKMYTYGSSQSNEKRWCWALPVSLPWSQMSIVPEKAEDDRLFEVFSDAVFTRGTGDIRLWDNINESAQLNHLQPVTDFNETEGNPTFTPLAYALDPENEELKYEILHYYDNVDSEAGKKTTYVGFGLSVNEWSKYNDNVAAIVRQIGKMIVADRPLNSPLEKLVAPQVSDNSDGSASIVNNNVSAKSFYVAYDAPYNGSVPTANYICTSGQQPDADGNTLKYIKDKVIFAASVYNDTYSDVVRQQIKGNKTRYITRLSRKEDGARGQEARYPFEIETENGKNIAFPYNQSWSKKDYTVTRWDELDANGNILHSYTPGTVYTFNKDVTVYAHWEKNTVSITDLLNAEADEDQRTVKWEFLPSKGAPMIQIEENPKTPGIYPHEALLVGQLKAKDGRFIDLTLELDANVKEITTPEGDVLANGGKFNNRAHYDKPGTYRHDYAQVRTGTMMAIPAVYGMKVRYSQMSMDKTNDAGVGEKSSTYVSQSYLTDGTTKSETDKTPVRWNIVNPGLTLDADGAIVTGTDSKVAAANIKDNRLTGGYIFYSGGEKTAVLNSVESALFDLPADDKGKLNKNSGFMEGLYVTYPALYNLMEKFDLNPATSDLKGARDEATATLRIEEAKHTITDKIKYYDNDEANKTYTGTEVTLTSNFTHHMTNLVGANKEHYLPANTNTVFILKPAYGYYVGAKNSGSENYDKNYTFVVDEDKEAVILNNNQRYFDIPAANRGDAQYKDIPEDGSRMSFVLHPESFLHVNLKRWQTYTYDVYAYPMDWGNVEISTGTGRSNNNEYKEYPVGKKILLSATANRGYQFLEWQNAKGETLVEGNTDTGKRQQSVKEGVVLGKNTVINPFNPSSMLSDSQILITVGQDNSTADNNDDVTKGGDQHYVASIGQAKTGTAYYLFDKPIEMTGVVATGENKGDYIYGELLDPLSTVEQGEFYSPFTASFISTPATMTLYREGYTLMGWRAVTSLDDITPVSIDGLYDTRKDRYQTGTNKYYYYDYEDEDEEEEERFLQPILRKNQYHFSYRTEETTAEWDFRTSQYAEFMYELNSTNQYIQNTITEENPQGELKYCTHVDINGEEQDLPLKIRFPVKTARLDNTTNSEWCALGEGTVVEIPSGAGATFEIITYKKITTTNIDGHVLTDYTEDIDVQGTPMYTYRYSTNSPKTSVIMTVGDDYTYYKSIKVHLPASDKVTLTTMSSNLAYGTVKLKSAKGQDGSDVTPQHKEVTADGLPADQYTMGLGSTVELVTDRVHLYTIDHWEEIAHEYDDNGDFVLDENGNHKETVKIIENGKDGYTITETVPDPVSGLKNSVLRFTLNNYDTYIRAVYKVADTYQINYTSGKEAEGEAPGVTLIEQGEKFTVPASNHHLYLDGQTLRYWVDEDGNRFNLGQEYTPTSDLYLSPVFEVNEFTVMDINETATATWPLTRLGGTEGDKPYAGNGDVNVFYQSAAGVYVTQLWLGKDTPDDPSDDRFIDLKLDLNCTDGKVDNRSDGARCQVNGGTKFTVPVSQNCNISVNSQRVQLTTAGLTFEGKTPTISADGKQASYEYNGNSTALDIDFKENTYLTQVVAEYRPVQTEVPDLDYLTIDNISLGALGTAYKDITLAGLKSSGEATITVDLSHKTADDVPVVKGTATLGGYVTVTQASLDNATVTTKDNKVTAASTANVLVKTKDGVTVRVYKIHFNITPPDITPKIVDLKVDRKYQCDLQKMYDAALTDPDVEGTTYVNKQDYLRNIGAAGGAGNERVGINGVVTIKFNTVMKGATIPHSKLVAEDGRLVLLGDITTEGGQTLVFNYRDLDLDKVYHFTIPANSFETANGVKYAQPITFWFTTAKTAVEVKHKLIDFVVTHNQPSEFSVEEKKMVKKGSPVQMVTDECLANIQTLKNEDKIAGYGTLDEGIAMANDYKGAERFYILVPDGEYQLMGNDFIKSLSSAPVGNDGSPINALNGAQNVYNGITTVSHDNVSIIGQSREGTVIWNKPYFEGASYTATLKLNNSIANFYAQDLTLENRFDYKNAIKRANKANGVVFWDRGKRAVLKNVAMKSYQTIINTNSPNQFDDTRSYYEDCLISGHTYLLYGDGDHWFNNTTLQLRTGKGSAASVMIDAGHYDTQEIGYVLNGCTIDYQDATAQSYNEGKMMMAQPWKNSPAVTILDTKFNVLPTADGYKQASSSGLLLRIHEYNSVDKDKSVIDLSERSLRSSSPAAGSYDAVMTPREAAAYRQGVAAVLGGTDAYDPTLHTIQCAAPETALSDRRMVWNEDENALCYAVFYADEADKDDVTKYKLFTLTMDEELDISADDYLGMYFRVRAANQRGGLGPWSEPITYHFVGQYDLVVKNMYPSYNDDDKKAYVGKDGDGNVYSWSTICLPFGTVVPEGSLSNPETGAVDSSDSIAVYAVTKVNALDVHLRRVYHLWPNKGYVVFATATKKDKKDVASETRTYRFLGSTARQEGLASDSTLLRGYAPAFIPDADDPDDPTKATPSTVPLNRRNASVTCYTLAYKKAFGIGFYKFNGETLAPYRAWLDADLVDANVNDTADRNPDSQAARLHFIFDEDDDSFLGDIDAIRDVYHDSDDPLRGIDLNDPSTRIYTLEGLRITAEHLRRGLIYIINGQKVQWR